jgi:arylsulfatase A
MRVINTSTLLLACVAMIAAGDPSAAAAGQGGAAARQPGRPPNIIVILADDQGYGDLGSYGHPTIRTPNIDRLAAEGQRWTSFYAAPVCTPSRAQLLTGRLAIRTGLAAGVLFPDSTGGLQPGEITVAEVLKARGYATAAVGKWHLGVLPEYLPTSQGFDSYLGIPYSNDMDWTGAPVPGVQRLDSFQNPLIANFNVPLMRNDRIVERPADQTTITQRYTDEGIAFIKAHRSQPFFLYLAHNLPHVPLFRSKAFEGKSQRGLYGDAVEEIDANVGRMIAALRDLRLEQQTLVLYMSDNGPWAPYKEQGGSAGLLRGAKGSTWEGGVRVPAIFWWPGTIKTSVVTGIGSELDLLQTFASLAGAKPPADRLLDGYDLSPTLRGVAPSPRQTLMYYAGATLSAVRRGAYKAYFSSPEPVTGAGRGGTADTEPQLYNLDIDPSEKFDIAGANSAVVTELRAMAEAHKKTVVPVKNQIATRPSPAEPRQ